jgi:hypothetical protein
MSNRHKVFVSYHHANDENYKRIFELRFGNRFGVIVPGSVQMGDIDTNLKTETIRQKIRDDYLRDTSVTVVLVGQETWQRKHVDWEISSSLRNTDLNPRSGLLGILLPSHPDFGRPKFNPHLVPPRLADNVECGFATIYHWSEDPDKVQQWVHEAYLRKARIQPDNSRDLFGKNHTGSAWLD